MIEKIILDNLNKNSVSLLKIQSMILEDKEVEVNRWRKAYINSENGRNQVQEEILQPFKDAIFIIWGEFPTVVEES